MLLMCIHFKYQMHLILVPHFPVAILYKQNTPENNLCLQVYVLHLFQYLAGSQAWRFEDNKSVQNKGQESKWAER